MIDSSISYPYRIIDEGITCDVWEVSAYGNDNYEPLAGALSSWDYQTNLDLRRNLEIDPEALFTSCGLKDTDAELSLTVSLMSGASRKASRIIWNGEISQSGTETASVHFALHAPDLSGMFRLISEIIMTRPPSEPSAMAATRAGSRLWADEYVVDLEGSLSRFPMEVCDFSETFQDKALANAAWYLNWYPDDPDASFLGSVRLMLNSKRKAQLKRIENGDSETISLLLADIAAQMGSRLLRDENFCERYPDFDDESIGNVVADWLQEIFPGTDAQGIREVLEADPARFNARIQALMVYSDD